MWYLPVSMVNKLKIWRIEKICLNWNGPPDQLLFKKSSSLKVLQLFAILNPSLARFEPIRLGPSQFTTLTIFMNLELDMSRDNLFFSVSCLVVFTNWLNFWFRKIALFTYHENQFRHWFYLKELGDSSNNAPLFWVHNWTVLKMQFCDAWADLDQ